MTDTSVTPEPVASDSLLDAPEAKAAAALDFTNGKPDGFPDEFWDAEKKAARADVIFNKYQEAEQRAKGLRDKLAKGTQAAPKEAKEYEVKLSEEVAKIIKSDDPLIEAARPIALKYGLSKEAFSGFIGEMAGEIAKMQQPKDADQEAEKAAFEAYRSEQIAKLGPNGTEVIKAVTTWGNELLNTGMFTEADLKAFKSMAYDAQTTRVLNVLRSMIGGGAVIPDVAASESGESLASVEQKMLDAFKSGNEAEYFRLEEQIGRMKRAG